jgi:Tol biopolymer transport system component
MDAFVATSTVNKVWLNTSVEPAPGLCSKIIFQSHRDGNAEVYVAESDGSNPARLTYDPATDAEAKFSPDGTKIAFMSRRDGNWQVYVMNADGTGQTNLSSNAADDGHPSWSPDGGRIAFHSYRDGSPEIYVMNADGTGQTRLTYNGADDVDASWSPSGSKIAFWSARDGNWEVYVMNVDGTGQTNLSNHAAKDIHPSWSPDGSRIAFTSTRPGGDNHEIYVMNADGTGQTRLTSHPSTDAVPGWSPDGTRIIFQSNRYGDYEILVMDAADGDGDGEGDNLVNLTNSPGDDYSPSWSVCPVANGTPVADAGGPYTGDEGHAVTFDGSGSADPDGNSLEYRWFIHGNWTDWSTIATTTHTWDDDYTGDVILEVRDQGLLGDCELTAVTINNVAPSVDARPDATINEGEVFTRAVSFTDPGADTWTGTVSFGDGDDPEPIEPIEPDSFFDINHTYAQDGVYTVVVTVTDDDGGVGSDEIIVAVDNVCPTLTGALSPFDTDDATAALYHLDEGSGNTAFDTSGHGNVRGQIRAGSVLRRRGRLRRDP